MRVNLDSDALAKGTLISPPGWYPCKLSGYKEEPAKTDKSTNSLATLTVLTGDFKGAGGRVLFNEKAMGFAKNFMLALGSKIVDGPNGKQLTGVLSPETVNNKLIDVYFARGTSNKGNDFNDAKDFAPIGTFTDYKQTA